jgi:hypothetical protein
VLNIVIEAWDQSVSILALPTVKLLAVAGIIPFRDIVFFPAEMVESTPKVT